MDIIHPIDLEVSPPINPGSPIYKTGKPVNDSNVNGDSINVDDEIPPIIQKEIEMPPTNRKSNRLKRAPKIISLVMHGKKHEEVKR